MQQAENPKLLGHAQILSKFGPRPGGGAFFSACFFTSDLGISTTVPGHVYSRGKKV